MKKNIFVLIVFVILTAIMTFPLVFKINTHMPGFFSTDEPYAALWDFWRIKYSLMYKISLTHTMYVTYPFGIAMHTEFTPYLWQYAIYLLAFIATPAITYNLQVLLNFVLRGLFTYLLISYITKNRFSAILGGIAFTFCPFQFVRSWQHLGLTYSQWIPLSLSAAILLKDGPTRRNMVLFLMAILLLFSFDFSIMYFGAAALAAFLIYALFYNWKTKLFSKRGLFADDFKYFAKIAVAGAIAFIILVPQFLPILTKSVRVSSTSVASGFNPYHRPFNDLFTQSAKPLSYLLPATTHPVFGRFTEQFIGSPLYGVSYTEHALYLGWVPLILAFIAFRRWRKSRLSEKDNFYIGFFVFLAVVAWLFSQPPYFTFPYFKIYMPSFFMYKIFPMFRAYCRFGIVVMLAVSVLAGLGLKFILERFKSNRARAIFTSLACGLVLFEFLNFPPFKVIDLTKHPAVYDWLKVQKGDFVIGEYPLDTEGPNEYYKFCQTIHEKKIINGTIPGTHANAVTRTIWKLSDPATAGVLSWMGVKYVLVHSGSYEASNDAELLNELDKIRAGGMKGLKFIRDFDNIDVYEVVAKPVRPD